MNKVNSVNVSSGLRTGPGRLQRSLAGKGVGMAEEVENCPAIAWACQGRGLSFPSCVSGG